MDFNKSDIQTMLLDSAERLLAENSGIEYWREQHRNALGFDEARWKQFAELGWLALAIPEDAGGLGGSIDDIALLNVELGKALATEPFISTAVGAAHILAHASNNDKSASMLEDIAAGSIRIALAHLEVGSDHTSSHDIATIATPDSDGFVLQGSKFMALDAPSADKLIVSAKIQGEQGVALFLLDNDAAGVTLESYPLIDGSRAADVAFDSVKLSSDALLAGCNAGETLLGEAIARMSVALMGQAVGSMEVSIAICKDYVHERKQFGTTIGSFQAIQHILADMFVASHQARSMLYHAIAHIASDPATRDGAISASRIVIGDAGKLVSRNGIQVHGGYGLTDEYAISHHFRRLMKLEKLFGDVDSHATRLGNLSLGG